MDAHQVLLGLLPLELADGLEEGLALHIADGAAHLGDYDVVVAGFAQQEHPALDFVCDVGDDLDGLSQICPFPLLGYHCVVNPSGGDVVRLGGVDAEEALIVAQVEVGFCAVLSHIAFAVFVGIEGSWIDVDVGVEFLDGYPEAPCLQQFAERCRNDSFS